MAERAGKQLIVVLGASGLLGTAVTRELAGHPVRLRLVGRRPSAEPHGCVAEIDVRTLDLAEDGALESVVADADVVVHLVAHIAGPGTWRVADGDRVAERVNLGLVHDLIALLGERRSAVPPVLLFAGSMSQVGRASAARIDGRDPDLPLTAYDRHKLAAERAIEAATARGQVRGITLRLATLFSRGTDPTKLDRGVVAVMMRRAFAGEPLTMWHDGTVKRDLLSVDDAARAFVAALAHADLLAGRHWMVGTGRATSVADLFGMIASVVAEHTAKPPVPVISVRPAAHSAETDLVDFVVDPRAFQQATGWCAAPALAADLRRAAAAFAAEGELVPGG